MCEVRDFFNVVNAGLGNLPAEAIDLKSIDWSKLYTLTCEQGLQAVAWDGLKAIAQQNNQKIDELIPKSLKLRWALSTEQIETKYAAQREVIAELAEFYSNHGIRTMLLKGYGLSLLYPTPNHRPCGDVDIWLYGEQQRADDYLLKEKGIKVSYDHEHHTVFHYKGVMVENHYDFMNKQSHLSNRRINTHLLEFSHQESKTIEVNENKIYLPPVNMNALFLLRHAASHFAAVGIKIRHIIDWALFIQSESQNIDWEAIEEIAKDQNMDRFLHSLYAISIDYLGFSPEIFPDFPKDKELETKVLNDILFSKDNRPTGFFKLNSYRLSRWWKNRWKNQIVYKENLFLSFIIQVRSHLLRPSTFLRTK